VQLRRDVPPEPVHVQLRRPVTEMVSPRARKMHEYVFNLLQRVRFQVPRTAVVVEAERQPAGGAGGVRRRPHRRRAGDEDDVINDTF
jgi:hypothetical protein